MQLGENSKVENIQYCQFLQHFWKFSLNPAKILPESDLEPNLGTLLHEVDGDIVPTSALCSPNAMAS